ncbi:MAG: WG repeat-containing protein [Clostridia bacterium]|nr:WG repeat-containing protein [Clostridia bacterium]
MRKKKLICIILIVLIIGIILIINIKENKKYQYYVEKLEKINYFLFMQNNKYGVIDRNGNVIIEPNYDIIEIPNPSKDVFICKSNYDASKNEFKVQVFNEGKQPILYQYYIVEAIALDSVENNGYYEKSVLKYKSNGLYGLIDFSGKKITKAIYESIDGFEFNEGLMLVKKAGKYGIINMNGAVVVKPKYDKIYSDKYLNSNGYKDSGYIVGEKTNDGMRYGYINSERKMLLKNEYNDIYRIEEKNDSTYLIAFKDGKAGIYNKKKNIMKHNFEDIEYNAQNDLLIVQKASKQGVIRFDGSVIVPIEYDNILFAGSYINAKNGDKVDIFDENGNKEQNESYSSKQDFNNKKYAIVSTIEDEFKIIINDSGKVVEDGYSYAQYLYENFFIVCKDKKFGIINDNGDSVIECKYKVIQPTMEYSIIQLLDENENIEILDKNFNTIVKPSKTSISTYNGLLKISTKNEELYINKDGRIVKDIEVENGDNMYPENIKDYQKIDLGYGCPYYVIQSKES